VRSNRCAVRATRARDELTACFGTSRGSALARFADYCRQDASLKQYGMLILIGLLFILPMLGAQLGADFNIVSQVIASSTDSIIRTILRLTGNT
jgi:hypothetical protein